MNNLSQYITEKLKINKDSKNINDNSNDMLVSYDIEELSLIGENQKQISRFLKGKDHLSALTIYFVKNKKYLHIFRYSDMHSIEISFVYKDNSNWPGTEEWLNDGNKIKSHLDDRDTMDNLFDDFFKEIKEFIK